LLWTVWHAEPQQPTPWQHEPLQTTFGDGHALVHVPPLQTWPLPHVFPHMPQLCPSVISSTQTPLHSV
jgi:hypothetical protein